MPDRFIPLTLAVLGAVVGGIGSLLGHDIPDLSGAAMDAWEGSIIALASTGVHQVWVQHKKGKVSE